MVGTIVVPGADLPAGQPASSTSSTASWTRGSPMTDTTRDPLLDTESVVPVTIGATGEPEAPLSAPDKGEKARSLGSDAWNELRHRPMFWISAVLIVIFVLMAAVPAAVHQHRPLLRRSLQGARGAVRRRPGSAATRRATTSTPAPSTALGPRSWSGIFATLFAWSSARSSASSPATGAAGSTRCSAGSARSSSASRCCWAASCSSTSSPATRDTPFLVQVGKVALVLGILGWPRDHAADALQRAAGQAERLRAGGPGARRHARAGSSAPTSCPTRWPR